MKKRKTTISCSCCPVKHLCLAGNIASIAVEPLEQVISYGHIYQPGETIYHNHDEAKKLFAIYKGLTKTYHIDKNGNQYIQEFYFPGDIMGLENLNQATYQTNAVALKETIICMIPVNELLEVSRHYPSVQKALIDTLCKKIQNQTEVYITTSAKKRVAAFYLNLVKREKERSYDEAHLPVHIKQIDISNRLGLANETFNRILKSFIKDNIIQIKANRIHYINLTKLKAFLLSC
jgi:CRP/FNR family transcriptional regulator